MILVLAYTSKGQEGHASYDNPLKKFLLQVQGPVLSDRTHHSVTSPVLEDFLRVSHFGVFEYFFFFFFFFITFQYLLANYQLSNTL